LNLFRVSGFFRLQFLCLNVPAPCFLPGLNRSLGYFLQSFGSGADLNCIGGSGLRLPGGRRRWLARCRCCRLLNWWLWLNWSCITYWTDHL
jgi:hypothetical protein